MEEPNENYISWINTPKTSSVNQRNDTTLNFPLSNMSFWKNDNGTRPTPPTLQPSKSQPTKEVDKKNTVDLYKEIKKRKRRTRDSHNKKASGKTECAWCKDANTPEWRSGPENVILCNACGLQYRNKLKKDAETRKKFSIDNMLNPTGTVVSEKNGEKTTSKRAKVQCTEVSIPNSSIVEAPVQQHRKESEEKEKSNTTNGNTYIRFIHEFVDTKPEAISFNDEQMKTLDNLLVSFENDASKFKDEKNIVFKKVMNLPHNHPHLFILNHNRFIEHDKIQEEQPKINKPPIPLIYSSSTPFAPLSQSDATFLPCDEDTDNDTLTI